MRLIDTKEKIVDIGKSVVFENKTDSSFEVSTGIVFHKSGIYEVSILGNRTVVSKVTEKKTGKWVRNYSMIQCSECKRSSWSLSFEDLVKSFNYCPNCGARMVKDSDAKDD